jgi:putative lipoprotein
MLLLAIMAMSGCMEKDTGTDKSVKTLSGEVFYRERMMLPPGSTLTVALEDVSRMDVPAEILASATYTPETAPPYAFALTYDPEQIQPNHRYALRARIESNEQLMFINMEHVPAFAVPEGQTVRMLVRRVPGQRSVKPAVPLKQTHWKLTQIGVQTLPEDIGAKQPFMEIQKKEQRILGFAGCNTFTGYYELSRTQVELLGLASTRKHCDKHMDIEQAFKEALAQVSFWKLKDEKLELYGQNDELLLTFSAEINPRQ